MSAPVETKTCALPSCAKPLVRKPGEWLTRFAARTYCDGACSAAARRRSARVPRVCAYEVCATLLVRYPRESSGHFTRRRFCKPKCHQDMRAAEAVAVRLANRKPCARPGCVDVVAQHDWEPASSWRKRAACSVSCAVRMRHRPKVEAPVKPKAVKPRPRAVKAVPPPCQVPPQLPPSVTVWRPAAHGWVLRPGDAGYQEEEAS